MTNVTQKTDYKGYILEITVQMDAVDCFPMFNEFKFVGVESNEALDKEIELLHSKSDAELDLLFKELEWSYAYGEAVSDNLENAWR